MCTEGLTQSDLPPLKLWSQGPAGNKFTIADWSGVQTQPALVYNDKQQEYFVVYENAATKSIYGQRVSTGGVPLGAALSISTGPGDGTQPAVAYNSQKNQYLVAWHYDIEKTATSVMEHGIRVIILSGMGIPVSGQIRTHYSNFFNTDFEQPAIAYDNAEDKYLLVYRFFNWPYQSGALLADVLKSDGSEAGPLSDEYTCPGIFGPFDQKDCLAPYSADNPQRPAVAYNSASKQFLVVWQATIGNNPITPKHEVDILVD